MTPLIDPKRLEQVALSSREKQRYARHLTIPEVGSEGQRRLKAARVLCIGAGGLGSPVTLYLAAAGVGRIGLVDPDEVDYSNLQRQILHGESDIGRSKLDSARDRLREINPGVELELHRERFEAACAMDLVSSYDLVIDGTDNFPTRYLSNDVCVLLGKPNVYGSIFRFEGQCSLFDPTRGGPCYRCLFPEPPAPGMVPSCAEGGVLGVLPGIVGCLQATEAIKLLLNIGDPLIGRLVHFDALKFRFREFKVNRDPSCPLCGDHPSITAPIDYEAFCGIRGEDSDQAMGPASTAQPGTTDAIPEISVQDLADRRRDKAPSFFLLDVREPVEAEICALEGATLIPLGELPQRLGELPRDRDILVHCKAGGRSAKAVGLLRERGFEPVFNVAGGINAWSREIDPSVPLY